MHVFLLACATLGFHVGRGGASPCEEEHCSSDTSVSQAVAGDAMLMTKQRHSQGRLDLEAGAATHVWTLVARQTMPGLFVAGEWSKNEGNPDSDNYAILDRLEEFRVDGAFEFKLVWPGKAVQHWSQTSNPVTRTQGGVTGYEGIETPFSGNRWGGLEHGTGGQTLLDGSVSHGNWWYAVGSFRTHEGGYPGPDGVVQKVELWASAPELETPVGNDETEESLVRVVEAPKDSFVLSLTGKKIAACSGRNDGRNPTEDECEAAATEAMEKKHFGFQPLLETGSFENYAPGCTLKSGNTWHMLYNRNDNGQSEKMYYSVCSEKM